MLTGLESDADIVVDVLFVDDQGRSQAFVAHQVGEGIELALLFVTHDQTIVMNAGVPGGQTGDLVLGHNCWSPSRDTWIWHRVHLVLQYKIGQWC